MVCYGTKISKWYILKKVCLAALLCFLYLIVYGWVWRIITTMEKSANEGTKLLLQPTSFLQFLEKKNQIIWSLMGTGLYEPVRDTYGCVRSCVMKSELLKRRKMSLRLWHCKELFRAIQLASWEEDRKMKSIASAIHSCVWKAIGIKIISPVGRSSSVLGRRIRPEHLLPPAPLHWTLGILGPAEDTHNLVIAQIYQISSALIGWEEWDAP